MTDGQKRSLGVGDFWEYRGRQCFWLTRNVSYRAGAVLAWVAYRLGIGPDAVSLASLVAGVGGAAAVAWASGPGILGGGALFVMLHLAYGLDCADGLLARATGSGSRFGMLLDKVIDAFGIATVPILLAGGLPGGGPIIPEIACAAALGLCVSSRTALAAAIWLRDVSEHGMDRLRGDGRERTPVWYLRRVVGDLNDEVVYRTALAVGWATGYLWEVFACYGALSFLLCVVYMWGARRAMGGS